MLNGGIFFDPHNSVPQSRIVENFEAPSLAPIRQPRCARLAALITEGALGHRLEWDGGRKKSILGTTSLREIFLFLIRFGQTRCPPKGLEALFKIGVPIFDNYCLRKVIPQKVKLTICGGKVSNHHSLVLQSRIFEIFEDLGLASIRQPRCARLAALVTEGALGHRLKGTGGREKSVWGYFQTLFSPEPLRRFWQTRCLLIGLWALFKIGVPNFDKCRIKGDILKKALKIVLGAFEPPLKKLGAKNQKSGFVIWCEIFMRIQRCHPGGASSRYKVWPPIMNWCPNFRGILRRCPLTPRGVTQRVALRNLSSFPRGLPSALKMGSLSASGHIWQGGSQKISSPPPKKLDDKKNLKKFTKNVLPPVACTHEILSKSYLPFSSNFEKNICGLFQMGRQKSIRNRMLRCLIPPTLGVVGIGVESEGQRY
jgi:hypothetical protein